MDESEPHLLVVDDDTRLRDLLRRYLSEQGFRVTVAADAGEARTKMASFAFDLLVLDVMMPGENGLSLTRELRGRGAMPRLPVLLLTAMAEPEDRINGLEHGADDYLVKPFEPRELVLRIRNILERRGGGDPPDATIRFGAFRYDPARAALFRGDDMVHLTTAEATLLASLAAQPGDAVSREDLSQSAQFTGNIRNVDVQMTRLRRKIEVDPRFPRYLQTVRGRGYVLKPD
ncbi:MAG: response regulator transcription factor [Alphaproteobacteria bacterium]|nr:response regulator transcription factor [Alphaproteobacteria bacterium]